jgi:hypothetical protein
MKEMSVMGDVEIKLKGIETFNNEFPKFHLGLLSRIAKNVVSHSILRG